MESKKFKDYTHEELVEDARRIDDLRRQIGNRSRELQAEAFETYLKALGNLFDADFFIESDSDSDPDSE
ncbi:hypothetical protein KKB41_04020 [Patescibacteria group bacterium]|nr:hypothetical protein [Patescibacteria group bacterium]